MVLQRDELQNEVDDCKQHNGGHSTAAPPVFTTAQTTTVAPEQTTTVAPDLSGYRLPSHIVPKSYDLTLYPNLEDGTFRGVVKIKVYVQIDSSEIRIHSKGLKIDKVLIDGIASSVEENKIYELLMLSKPNAAVIQKGNRDIQIDYSGDMKNRIVGLYTSSYIAEGGKKIPIATSKFEPTYARQAFPCFDEPNMKVKFTVHILKPVAKEYIALSNMRQTSEIATEGGVMVDFEESKEMSTYLACFIVCDFEHTKSVIEANIGEKIPLKVFATRAQVKNTQFALNSTVNIMKYFIEYFDIPYPLPKLDLIAIPDFVSGAMEHWGLVTFRETSLLYDEEKSSSGNKQRVVEVVAHELAHSWFGNLVTMNWWNDLWLNEGFASYIETKGMAHVYPEWDMMDQFLIDTMHSVLSLDATPSSHPIVQTVVTPDQITEIFDSITYDKGASLLRMLDNAITEETFRKGVKEYLLKYRYGNAVTQYLWDELQKLVPKDVSITDIMGTWTVQMGYPILTVTDEGKEYVLTQKRFLKDYSNTVAKSSPYGYKWSVPVTFVTDLAPKKAETRWFKHDQPNIKITKPPGIKWIKFNHDQVGYYRVNYTPDHWKLLAANMAQMTTSDKAHLLEESFSIAESGDLSYDIPLQLTSYLQKEFHYVLWSIGAGKIGSLRKYLIDSPDYNEYLKYRSKLVFNAYKSIGWLESAQDTHLKRRVRSIILSFACQSGIADCLTTAKTKFDLWLKDPAKNPVSQELRNIVYHYGMEGGGKDEWFNLLNLYKKEIDANEKLKMLEALAAVKETWLLQHLIQLGTIEGEGQLIRSQDYFTMLGYISSNPIGTSIVWNYVRENWKYLEERFGLNERYLGRLIPTITSSFTMNLQLQEMETFFAANPNAGAGALARKQALTNVKNNIKWVRSNRNSVISWLKKHNSQ
ncbi:glutamyl aminopeptidase-like isoform X2 [Photinus pyralis]|nr:glutamyl aminopeptidase-like isoform X2 [Photinus pyralis]